MIALYRLGCERNFHDSQADGPADGPATDIAETKIEYCGL
jgi:hypothetical protein